MKNSLKILRFGMILVVVIVYLPLVQGYFLQDEWFAFGKLYYNSQFGIVSQITSYFAFDTGHYVPFHRIVFLLFERVWGLKYEAWSVMSILWHIVNICLVYNIGKRVTKDNTTGILIGLLFGLSASIHQATTWVGANINTHGATTFALLSFLYFLRFRETSSTSTLHKSLSMLLISLLFKEIAVGMFAVYALYILLYLRKEKRALFEVVIAGVAYVVFRLLMIVTSSEESQVIASQSQSISEIVINILTAPVHMISQTIVPQRLYLDFAYWIARNIPEFMRPSEGVTAFDVFAQETVMVWVSIVIFSLFTIFVFARKTRTKFLLYAFIVFNSLVFALSPERIGKIVVMDSRNMYLVAAAVFALIGIISFSAIQNMKMRMGVLGLLLLFNAYSLHSILGLLRQEGILREEIVGRVVSDIGQTGNIVLYTNSDSSYYGLSPEDTIMPFQSGFGHTILVTIAYRDNLSPEFFSDRFLWDIQEQGYQIHENRGFGYYRQRDKLQELSNNYTIEPSEIYSYRWESEINGLTNITDETLMYLQDETN